MIHTRFFLEYMLLTGFVLMTNGCSNDSDNENGNPSSSDGDSDGDGDGDTDSDGDSDSDSDSDLDAPRHDICADIGNTLGMGGAIFGDTGTEWVLNAAQAPNNINWTYGYMYASGDPHEDLDGFDWIINFRMDSIEEMGATIPTVTFYRMLNVGEEHGYSGSEPQIVQQMLQDKDAVRDYIDDFIVLLEVLDTRTAPTLVHVEPDSWGFMMWAFDGIDGTTGNSQASAVPVDISGANHDSLSGQSFSDDAGGLGRAMLYLRNQFAPKLRMGWHASNFRVGTSPSVVTEFYSSMGSWDVIVTEPPHMVSSGAGDWDGSEADNAANLDWFHTVSSTTNLPILIWQAYVDDAAPYIGNWSSSQANLIYLVDNGLSGVLWDPNGMGNDCGYTCPGASDLLTYLSNYSTAPLQFPSTHICSQ